MAAVSVVCSPLTGANGSRWECTGTATGGAPGRGRRDTGAVCSSGRTLVCTTGAGAAVPIVRAIGCRNPSTNISPSTTSTVSTRGSASARRRFRLDRLDMSGRATGGSRTGGVQRAAVVTPMSSTRWTQTRMAGCHHLGRWPTRTRLVLFDHSAAQYRSIPPGDPALHHRRIHSTEQPAVIARGRVVSGQPQSAVALHLANPLHDEQLGPVGTT